MLKKICFVVMVLLLTIVPHIRDKNCYAKEEPYHVLILYSQHYSHTWTNELHKGISEALKDDAIYLYPEYLNEHLLSDKIDYSHIYTFLLSHYENYEFDCIVLVDNYAFDFMSEYYNELFPSIPVVFVGVNGFGKQMMFTNDMTGIPQNADKIKSVELITSLDVADDNLIFVTSTNSTGSAELKEFKELLDAQFSNIDYSFIISDTLEEAHESLKEVDSAKLITIGNIRTQNGEILNPTDLITSYYSITQLPIFTMNRLHISEEPNSALGGYVTDPYEHGYEAGKLALRILNGERASDIPITDYSPSSYVFNYYMLEHFDIDESLLPKGCTIVGKPDETVLLKRNIAISGFVLLIITIVLSIILTILVISKVRDNIKINESSSLLLEYNTKLELEKSTIQKKEKENLMLLGKLREQQKLDSISTLAGGVAHEINNPINGIMNYGQIILDSESGTVANKKYAKEIIYETGRVSAIVKNLLDFSRHNKQEHSYANIEDIIMKTVSLINTLIKKDQINFHVYIEPTIPKVKCRSQQIQQVIMNLLTNARDALNEKYPKYDENKIIRLSCSKYVLNDRNWIKIEVEDHGNGIPDDIKEKMFDPFFTTKDKAEGTGLGLSISYGIVKEHHGEIKYNSKIGEYTKFILNIPCDNGWEL